MLPVDLNSNGVDLGVGLIKIEQKYLDLFSDKYNINPEAGKTRLGAKHSEATKELMSKETKEEKSKETRTLSTEVRQDLKITSDKLNNLTKLRVFNVRLGDPQVRADLDNPEGVIESCYTEARRRGIFTKVGSDMLNEYSMRNGMLSVHKSEYTASKLNITRTQEET